ncbi:hypothetical protein MLD38_031546 [Melastoma candidum]|uniref:Uncharacterized protein n=1 Tax=Melastoma candidum TaxID=119954 RepID=A0ACB9MRV9_9MYRT|nr:hypothetical protein MLD38_031546 [Melastoma candidum]
MHILYRSALALPQGRPSFGPRVSCHGARDRVVDFGKYKGRMLGTLPSSYLRWVSNNLRAGDFEHWARLADQVLRDPVYNDRIEWEFAEAVLKGSNGPRFYSLRDGDGGPAAELLEISQRFGWDYEDKAAWSKVDFDLLGTSRGGRIPRVGDRCGGVSEAGGRNSGGREGGGVAAAVGIDERRRGRRERAMMKMKKEKGACAASAAAEVATLMTGRRDGGGSGKRSVVEANGEGERSLNSVHNPFPGRESLLRKVLGTRGRRSHHANGMEG